jgi:hypothetical protein
MTIRAVKHSSYQPYPVENNDEFLSPSRPDVASCSITLIRRLLLATFSGYDMEELRSYEGGSDGVVCLQSHNIAVKAR